MSASSQTISADGGAPASPAAVNTPSSAAETGKSAHGILRTAAKKRAARITSAPPAARTQQTSGSAKSPSASPSHKTEIARGERTAGSMAQKAASSARTSALPARPLKNASAPVRASVNVSPPAFAGSLFGTHAPNGICAPYFKIFSSFCKSTSFSSGVPTVMRQKSRSTGLSQKRTSTPSCFKRV